MTLGPVSAPIMHCFSGQDGDPVRPGVAMTDLATGLYAHGAVMAALLQREKTGRGVHIDCNLLSSQVTHLKPPQPHQAPSPSYKQDQ